MKAFLDDLDLDPLYLLAVAVLVVMSFSAGREQGYDEGRQMVLDRQKALAARLAPKAEPVIIQQQLVR